MGSALSSSSESPRSSRRGLASVLAGLVLVPFLREEDEVPSEDPSGAVVAAGAVADGGFARVLGLCARQVRGDNEL